MPTFGYGATYGNFLYGAQKYGSTANLNAIFNWEIMIDWDGDGLFEANEANRFINFQCDRGRKNFVQADGSGFFPISPGVYHITLDNYDGRFDAWNTSSPLYPNVIYGKDIKIITIDISTNTKYAIFYGVISDIVPSGYGTNAIVKITAEDGIKYLRNIVQQVNIISIPSDIINMYLSIRDFTTNYPYSIWPSRWGKNIYPSTGGSVQFYNDFTQTKNAMDEINDFCNSNLCTFFIAGDGRATFYNRDDIVPASPVTYDKSILLKDIGNSQPWVNFRNIIKLYYSTSAPPSNPLTTYSTYPLTSVQDTITQPRFFIMKTPYNQSTASIDTIASTIGTVLTANNKVPIIQLVNRPSYQFPELFDTINVTISTLGINQSFRVGGISHNGTPQEVFTTLFLEPKIST